METVSVKSIDLEVIEVEEVQPTCHTLEVVDREEVVPTCHQ
jgi:hypothetical protein